MYLGGLQICPKSSQNQRNTASLFNTYFGNHGCWTLADIIKVKCIEFLKICKTEVSLNLLFVDYTTCKWLLRHLPIINLFLHCALKLKRNLLRNERPFTRSKQMVHHFNFTTFHTQIKEQTTPMRIIMVGSLGFFHPRILLAHSRKPSEWKGKKIQSQ